ncbi:NAD(P)/FAD-dependent oxidoreductase [Rhizobium sp. AAP43]|uniref:NAD(P)/FAD-dependent oxidoreductase n=1 Tax=Rhizobium sp. AAP43 TaxID=1523420 RepID=UPI0006B99578|nr:FAD-dependent oxidoreductase [Rhizobium sp. AAP43]KPF41271.1 hypothetical protein IP76_21740 [Rhizobium sp. AAP43]
MKHVIIGAGEAGLRAAIALRGAGEQHIILLNGETLAPYERPALSKPTNDHGYHRPIDADVSGIDARIGTLAVDINPVARSIRCDDGADIFYDRLLLATGARARKLAMPDMTQALTLRTASDAKAIYAKAEPGGNAVIIGAGLIGLEMAAELNSRGLTVTVVEAGPRALGRAVPALLAGMIVERHGEAGVRFLFDQSVQAIGPKTVTLGDGTILPADLTIVAIGVEPNVELASGAGISCENGILTDQQLKTSEDGIYAAGDCAAINHPRYGTMRFETWRNAVDQGSFAAAAMLGSTEAFTALPWFWSDQYNLGLQGVGLHKPERTTIRRDLTDGGVLLFELDEDGILQAAYGLAKGNLVAKDIRLAEKLIERNAVIAPENLADQGYALKSALKSSAQV